MAGQAVCSSHRDAGSRVPSDAHSPARGMTPSLHFRISENGGRRPRLRGCSQDQVRRRTWASRPNRRTAADRAVSSRHWRPGVKPGKCRPSARGPSPGPGVWGTGAGKRTSPTAPRGRQVSGERPLQNPPERLLRVTLKGIQAVPAMWEGRGSWTSAGERSGQPVCCRRWYATTQDAGPSTPTWGRETEAPRQSSVTVSTGPPRRWGCVSGCPDPAPGQALREAPGVPSAATGGRVALTFSASSWQRGGEGEQCGLPRAHSAFSGSQGLAEGRRLAGGWEASVSGQGPCCPHKRPPSRMRSLHLRGSSWWLQAGR